MGDDDWREYWDMYDMTQPVTMQVVSEGFVQQPGFIPRRERAETHCRIGKVRRK